MASSEEFTQYVIGQLEEVGCITYKKLFGEYGLWYEGKFFGTVEDNQFYVKKQRPGKNFCRGQNRWRPTEEHRVCMRWKNWMIKPFWQNLSGRPVPSFRRQNPESQRLKRRNQSKKRTCLKDRERGIYDKN